MTLLSIMLLLISTGDTVAIDDAMLDSRTREKALRLALPQKVPPDPTNEVADDPQAVELGRMLFRDRKLSGDGTMSCATCHPPEGFFTDGKVRPRGPARFPRDTPTLWNAGWQRWFGWDGRSDSLWMQALEPIESPAEMNGDRLEVIRYIAGDDDLRRRFEDLFGPLPAEEGWPRRARIDGEMCEEYQALPVETRHRIDGAFAAVGKAIAAFERTLIRADSGFDAYLDALRRGDEEAARNYPLKARRGLEIFLGRGGCSSCHSGPALSDGEFHDTGVPSVDGRRSQDPGRYGAIDALKGSSFNAVSSHSAASDGAPGRRTAALRRRGDQWGAFRTPSLRFVADTGPYFHHGGLADLESVVRFYNRREGAVRSGHHDEATLQPLGLNEVEEGHLVEFLRSLSGAGDRP